MMSLAYALVKEALEEDRRAGRGRFDAAGFANFFPEEKEEDVRDAWVIYDALVSTR